MLKFFYPISQHKKLSENWYLLSENVVSEHEKKISSLTLFGVKIKKTMFLSFDKVNICMISQEPFSVSLCKDVKFEMTKKPESTQTEKKNCMHWCVHSVSA